VLTFAQGFLVRRAAGRLSEATMAAGGAILEVVGFAIMLVAVQTSSTPVLFAALTVVVIGFAFMQPSLNALISRRSDPAKQGSILGVAQSVGSLARIVGPLVAFPLLYRAAALPYLSASVLLGIGFVLILYSAHRGRDYGSGPGAG
jgi:fucose permease